MKGIFNMELKGILQWKLEKTAQTLTVSNR